METFARANQKGGHPTRHRKAPQRLRPYRVGAVHQHVRVSATVCSPSNVHEPSGRYHATWPKAPHLVVVRSPVGLWEALLCCPV